MYVTRNGNHTASPIEDVHNNHLYSGNENEITISRVFATTFSCEFYLSYYPFDIQNCSMDFVLQVGWTIMSWLKKQKKIKIIFVRATPTSS